MQQKNDFPENHQEQERQLSAVALKIFTSKFFAALEPAPIPTPNPLNQNAGQSCQKRTREKASKDNLSVVSQLDDCDLLFLEEFDENEQKSTFPEIITLTSNNKPLHYTESMVINVETSNSYHQESIIENVSPNLPQPKTDPQEKREKRRCTQIQFENGAVFRGEVKDGKMVRGTFVLRNVFTYAGEFEGDMFHGNGTLILEKGHKIVCLWSRGKPLSNAVIHYPYGQRYEGGIQNFKKNGVGCLYFKDGSRYVGQFQNDQITGQGCYYSLDGQDFRGCWVKGEYQGEISFNSFPSYNFSEQSSCMARKGSGKQPSYRQRLQIN